MSIYCDRCKTTVARGHGCRCLQPEPCVFVAPLDLDERRCQNCRDTPGQCSLCRRNIPVSVEFIVTFVACAVVFLCAMALASGCATTRTWSPPTATLVLPAAAPECAGWAAQEAWSYLGNGVPLVLTRSPVAGLGDGMILVDWRPPADYPRTLAWAMPFGDRKDWAASRSIVRAVVRIQTCELRMWMHELGHVRGLANLDAPGFLMTAQFPKGSYALSRRERRVLEGR